MEISDFLIFSFFSIFFFARLKSKINIRKSSNIFDPLCSRLYSTIKCGFLWSFLRSLCHSKVIIIWLDGENSWEFENFPLAVAAKKPSRVCDSRYKLVEMFMRTNLANPHTSWRWDISWSWNSTKKRYKTTSKEIKAFVARKWRTKTFSARFASIKDKKSDTERLQHHKDDFFVWSFFLPPFLSFSAH